MVRGFTLCSTAAHATPSLLAAEYGSCHNFTANATDSQDSRLQGCVLHIVVAASKTVKQPANNNDMIGLDALL